MDATERDQWREADRLFDALIELAQTAGAGPGGARATDA